MRRKSFDDQACGIARALEAIGDGWGFLILREAMFGVDAFDGFVERLGIPRNTLAAKLEGLVAHGIMVKEPDPEDGRRSRYALTQAGEELWVVLLALQQWGNKWRFGKKGAPSFMADRATRRAVSTLVVQDKDGTPLDLDEVTMIPGPSAPAALKRIFDALPE
ncbi:MAG: helix-turn-helix domain-containing protein [Pseudomonadota bacterium]